MGFVHDRPATRLAPQTVVAEVFGPERRNGVRSDLSTGTGMNPGPRLDDADVQIALQQSLLFGHANKGLIASIAMVLATDDEIKDLNRQRDRIARDQGGETPLLIQVANEARARLDVQRAEAMKSLASSLGMGEQGFPSVDLSALVAERARQQ
jgi:hypothetical protein